MVTIASIRVYLRSSASYFRMKFRDALTGALAPYIFKEVSACVSASYPKNRFRTWSAR